MCSAPKAATSAPVKQQEPIQEPTLADAGVTKASAIERNKAEGLAGRDTKTGARGLGDEAKSRKKTLLGE